MARSYRNVNRANKHRPVFINPASLVNVFRICFYGTVSDTVRRLCSLQRFHTWSLLPLNFFIVYLYRHAPSALWAHTG